MSTSTSRYRRFLITSLAAVRTKLALGVVALLVVSVADAALPLLLKESVDTITKLPTSYSTLLFCALTYFLIAAIQATARLVYRTSLGRAQTQCGSSLRASLSKKIFQLPHFTLHSTKSGDLVNRFESDVESISILCDSGTITLVDAIAYTTLMPLIMLWLAPSTSPFVLLPLLGIPFLTRFFERRIQSRYSSYQKSQDALISFSQESVRGLRLVKSAACEDSIIRHYRNLGDDSVRVGLRLARVDATIGPAFESLGILAALVLFALGGWHVSTGLISLGTFVALHKYIQRLLWPMQAIGVTLSLYQRALTSASRLVDILDLPTEGTLSSAPINRSQVVIGTESATPKSAPILLRFDNVSFSYPSTARPILSNISFQVERGETVALLGDVGSGKSTIFSLIPRLLIPTSGEILWENQRLSQLQLSLLREQVSLLPQEPFILSASLADNLNFAANQVVNEHDSLISSLDRAALPLLPSIFPAGLETQIGERGITLSGGQRQRLSIARAFLRSPALLIADDAFSALDSQTEASVLKELRAHAKALLLTSQRLATVLSADRIVVVVAGRIAQNGRPHDLLKESGSWFANFYERQRLVEEVENYVSL
ncbi:MAG: ABC transporter ATP-binding protein/permease [Oligoflexia bacterium]|nr:ABC transporter ATP-binding protein/permease [Oligoflexia bacterium]